MTPCILCGSPVSMLLDFGPQPVASRFLPEDATDLYRHPLKLGQCDSCALVQLVEPAPAAEVMPIHPWITYNEPETHLDDLVEHLTRLPGVPTDAVVGAVSCKDDTTLTRMRERGYTRTWRLELSRDLGVTEPAAGMESVTTSLTPERAAAIGARLGLADVLLCRHVLEHAYDVAGFLRAAMSLVAPGGLIVVEIPDASRDLDLRDYSSIWEEHTAYFTPATFTSVFERAGLEAVWATTYPYIFEDSLVLVARRSGSPSIPAVHDSEFGRARGFAGDHREHRARWRSAIEPYAERGRVALFGAGHVAVSFLDLLGLDDMVSFVADDSEHKQGMRMPGSGLPILPSHAVRSDAVSLCLMCLSPQAEEKVLAHVASYTGSGGTMASVVPASTHALRI